METVWIVVVTGLVLGILYIDEEGWGNKCLRI
jgi:hypothetical protein